MYDFVSMYPKLSSNVVTLRRFLKEVCLFLNLEYRKYAVSAVFSYMLRYIELKFCKCFYFNIPKIMFKCRYIELKFCI